MKTVKEESSESQWAVLSRKGKGGEVGGGGRSGPGPGLPGEGGRRSWLWRVFRGKQQGLLVNWKLKAARKREQARRTPGCVGQATACLVVTFLTMRKARSGRRNQKFGCS